MKGLLIVIVIASALAGCATHVRQADQGGYALPREGQPFLDRALWEATTDRERARAWSVRDFVTPRGLLQ
jgi:hypothetical protein